VASNVVTMLALLVVAGAVGALARYLVAAQEAQRRWNREQILEARRGASAPFWEAVEAEVARRPCNCRRRHRTMSQPPSSVDSAVLRLAATLTHPDRHPAERHADATRVTAALLSAYNSTRT
jgi:hypothetical protein